MGCLAGLLALQAACLLLGPGALLLAEMRFGAAVPDSALNPVFAASCRAWLQGIK